MPNWQELGDGPLLEYARAGDADAFAEVYERYAPRVFRFIFAHVNNRLDAEDLTEDVFLRVWRSLPGYRDKGVPFLAYVFRIARNRVIDHHRQSLRAADQVPLEEVILPASEPTPGEVVLANSYHEEVRQVLDLLREDYRMVLVLRFLTDLSPEETAQVMERTPGAVRVLQHRALAALRVLMDGNTR